MWCIATHLNHGIRNYWQSGRRKDCGGRGIGSEFLRRALTWLDSAGAASEIVALAFGNEKAMALYERLGFHSRTIAV